MPNAELVTAITTVGFPIVCCVVMGWYVKYMSDEHREEVEKLNSRHHTEMSEVTTAINNNTLALTKLCEKLEGKV